MQRTITVKGTGKVTAPPDYVILSMSLETQDDDYEEAMNCAAYHLNDLNKRLEEIGFEKSSVKTSSFNVHTDYDRVKGKDGNYHTEFNGYICSHRLKLEFDFNTKRLTEALCTVSKCLARPEISITFTVKDPDAVNEQLLKSAAVNAKEKAQVLCEASNVKLGQLLSIDYNWGELNLISRTSFALEDKCMAMSASPLSDMELEPDSIKVNDSATFVWEID